MMNRLFFLFVFVLFLVPSGNVWARGNPFADGVIVKRSDPYARPGYFRANVRGDVWNAALNPKSNRVHDPLTGKFIGRQAAWDVGHLPGKEFYKYSEISRQRRIPRNLFLDEYNNPAHYRPELPSSNRSHRLEAPREVNHYRDMVKGYGKRVKFKPVALSTNSVKSIKFARFAKVASRAGNSLLLVGGAFDLGYGVHAYYTAHQRYLAGELDWDIAAAKKALAVGHVIIGTGGITVGVLLLAAPEAVFTKAAGIALIVAGVTYIIVDFILDYYLEKIQAKRMQHRKEVLAKITWEARQSVCIEQLRKMI